VQRGNGVLFILQTNLMTVWHSPFVTSEPEGSECHANGAKSCEKANKKRNEKENLTNPI